MEKIQNLFILFIVTIVTCAFSQNNPKPLVLTRVTIIDVTGEPAKRDMTVVISEGKISKIGKTGKIAIPKNALVINSWGKFLIPGLWDMHIHWYAKEFLPLFIANGVTGVRQMFGFPMHKVWRQDIAKGKLLGPRMVIASPVVDGPIPVWPNSIAVANEKQARQAVAKIKKAGDDFVKVYSLLPRSAYFAIVKEAKKQKISFAGHTPFSVSIAEACKAGQKSIEHLTGILLACSTKEEEFRSKLVKAMQKGPIEAFKVKRALSKQLLETYSDKKAAALFKSFAKSDTWQCTTLLVIRNMAFLKDGIFENDPRLKYMPSYIKNAWKPKNDFRLKNKSAKSYILAKKTYQKLLKITGAMYKAKVKFIAGTDVLNPYCFPGFGLHDELALLVKAGCTPLEALQAATCNAAEYIGKSSFFGTVEEGKIADLVLLDANPLKDIGNTKKINAVVFNGKFFAKDMLHKILDHIEAIAKESAKKNLQKNKGQCH